MQTMAGAALDNAWTWLAQPGSLAQNAGQLPSLPSHELRQRSPITQWVDAMYAVSATGHQAITVSNKTVSSKPGIEDDLGGRGVLRVKLRRKTSQLTCSLLQSSPRPPPHHHHRGLPRKKAQLHLRPPFQMWASHSTAHLQWERAEGSD